MKLCLCDAPPTTQTSCFATERSSTVPRFLPAGHRGCASVGLRSLRRTWLQSLGPLGRSAELVDLAGGLLLPGFKDAHVHPVLAGLELSRCDLTAATDRPEYLAASRAYAARAPGRGVDHRRRLVDGGLPRRHAAPAGRSTRSSRTARCSCPTATPRRLGQHPRAGARRHRRAHPGPGRRPDRARRRRRRRRARCRRARWTWSARLMPAATAAEQVRRAARRPALPALARHHRLAGRHRRRLRRHARPARRLPAGRRPRRADGPGGRRAVVGPGPRRRADRRSCSSAASGGPGRALPRHQRQDHAGRRRARTSPPRCSSPTWTAHGCATGDSRARLRRPGRAARGTSPRSTRRASRCTSTRSATAPSARRSTRSRRPARRTARRQPAPPRAPAGRPPRRRAAVRRRSARPPTASRCGPRTSRRWTS